MTQPSGSCPNCGALIRFRWSASVQTVCEYCKSILVRTDLDLKKVGQVADLPPDSSPIQLGTEGSYNHKSFYCDRANHLRVRPRQLERVAPHDERWQQRVAVGCSG